MKHFFTAEAIFLTLGVLLTITLGKWFALLTPLLYMISRCDNVNEFMAKHVGTRPTKPPRG